MAFWDTVRGGIKGIGYSNPLTAGITGVADQLGLVTKALDPNIDLVPGVSITNRPGQTDINPFNSPPTTQRASGTSASGPLDGAGLSQTTTNPSGGGGGNGGSVTPQDQAAQKLAMARINADPLLQALSALDTTRGNRLSQNQGEYDTILRQYDDQDALDQAAHSDQVAKNEGQLASQRQGKMLSGARLFRNLAAVLGSMGALNGTGSFLASDAVRGITNEGLGQANETFDINAGNINSNWQEAEREARQRRLDAEKLLGDKNSNTEADILTNRQNVLNQLANLFGTDTAEGQGYASQAGALYGDIAKTTRPNVGKYAEASKLYSPAALKDYLSGIGDTVMSARPTSPGEGGNIPINSPLFAENRRKDKQLA